LFLLSSVRSINQSINLYSTIYSTEARATVQLCQIKEKCLETDLKCVNDWSSSTVQWKRVPKSRSGTLSLYTTTTTRSSNRETTSSSVQVVRRNWQKLLCGWSQQARLTVWADQVSEVAWLLERSSHLIKVQRVWSWSTAGLAATAGSVTVVQLMLSGWSCRRHGPVVERHVFASIWS